VYLVGCHVGAGVGKYSGPFGVSQQIEPQQYSICLFNDKSGLLIASQHPTQVALKKHMPLVAPQESSELWPEQSKPALLPAAVGWQQSVGFAVGETVGDGVGNFVGLDVGCSVG
jgi:hypothetical protein